MKSDAWIKALHTVKVLCAIDKPSQDDYIQGMYNELKDKFTDDDVVAAARQIAEKEELYGNYPSLRIWLKYCPQKKEQKAIDDKNKSEFLEAISAVLWLEPLIFDYSETEKDLKQRFGWKGFNTFRTAGFTLHRLRECYYMKESQKTKVVEQFSLAWDAADAKRPPIDVPMQLPHDVKVALLAQETKE